MSLWSNIKNQFKALPDVLSALKKGFDSTALGKLYNMSTDGTLLENAGNKYLGMGLTGAEREANEFTHNERLESQDWTAQREDTYYQRTMADMQQAGINPMMAAGGSAGVSGSSGGQSVSPSSGSLSDLFELSLLGPQKELMEAQAENLRAGAEEKRAKAPYWAQRIEESIEKIKTYSASAEKDIALAALNRAKAQTEDELREYEKSLKVSLRACADAETALKQEQASETEVRKGLEAAQKAYQESLNDEDMAKKVCAKIVAETDLAGASADKAEQDKVAMELANAMVRGDFVEVCLEQLRRSGHNEVNAAHIASQVMAIFKNILGMIKVGVSF